MSKMSNIHPNLFIIGSMKSGTTSLHNYLHEHPKIFMSKLKEPQYFSMVEYSADAYAAYLSLFEGTEEMCFRGESSTNYTKLPFFPGVAKRIHEFNKNARLIYLMREPLDRAISQYRHQIRMGRESRNLLNALQSNKEYLLNSYYAMQLRSYFEWFSKKALLLITFEAFIKTPQSICLKIFKWLGVDSSYIPSNIGTHYYETPDQLLRIRENSLMFNIRTLIRKSEFISRLIPAVFKTLYTKMAPKYVALDARNKSFHREISRAKEKYHSQLEEWNNELVEMTGIDVSEWSENK